MNKRPLLLLAAIAAVTSPDAGKDAFRRFTSGLRDGYARDPIGSVLAAVLGGAWLFYKAERGHNPKVTSYYDALVYIATNLSVGYSDIFAKTPQGKVIGAALMTFGPAMATNLLNTPRAEGASSVADTAMLSLRDALEALAGQVSAPPFGAAPSPSGDETPARSFASRTASPAAGTAMAPSRDVIDRLDRILALLEARH